MSYDNLFQQALNLHENGQLTEAERIYRQILETAPEQPEVLNLLGLVAQAKNAQSEACHLFYRAIKAAPERADLYFNLAFSLKLDHRPAEALENFRRVLELKPDVAAAYNEIALIEEQSGLLEQARANWQKAFQLDNSLIAAKVNYARSFRQQSPARAIEELEKLTKVYPGDAALWFFLSELYLHNGQDGPAWKAAGRAKELAPASDEVRVILGQLASREKQFDKAKIYFEKAALINPYNIAALIGVADMSAQTGNFEEAEQAYRRVIELDAENHAAHANLGELLYRQNRLAEALEEYRAAVIIDPGSAEVCNNLGLTVKDTGDLPQAAGLFYNALKLKPNLEAAAVNLAETLTIYQREHPAEALEMAHNWLNQMPDNIFAQQINAAFKGVSSAVHQIFNEKYFNHFADNYELVVKNIGYTVPLAMGKLAGNVEGAVVDLGCGTGLVGEVIKGPQNQITGVDLSKKMLDIAAGKGIYTRLVKADAVEFLQQNPGLNWVIAADVAGYIGDLSALVKAAAGSKLLFSIEKYCGTENYKLAPCGRYQHNPVYVENLLTQNGFKSIIKKDLVLRQEDGLPVDGLIFYAQ